MADNYKDKLENWLDNNVHWKKEDFSYLSTVFTPTTLKYEILNISYVLNNSDEAYILDNLYVYSIIKDELSEIYFSKTYGAFFPVINDKNTEILYIIFFEDSEYDYIATNSDRLFLQISVDIGVSKNDIKMKTDKYIAFKSYQNTLKHFEEYYVHKRIPGINNLK